MCNSVQCGLALYLACGLCSAFRYSDVKDGVNLFQHLIFQLFLVGSWRLKSKCLVNNYRIKNENS